MPNRKQIFVRSSTAAECSMIIVPIVQTRKLRPSETKGLTHPGPHRQAGAERGLESRPVYTQGSHCELPPFPGSLVQAVFTVS